MIKKIKNVFYISSFLIFIFVTIFFYFSEKNIVNTQKTRSAYIIEIDSKLKNIPLLKNNTKNIIEYSDDIENFKKKKKKYLFWKLLEE